MLIQETWVIPETPIPVSHIIDSLFENSRLSTVTYNDAPLQQPNYSQDSPQRKLSFPFVLTAGDRILVSLYKY